MPAAQFVQTDFPEFENFPVAHRRHDVSPTFPELGLYFPGLQTMQAWGDALYHVPAIQFRAAAIKSGLDAAAKYELLKAAKFEPITNPNSDIFTAINSE